MTKLINKITNTFLIFQNAKQNKLKTFKFPTILKLRVANKYNIIVVSS